MFLYFTMTWILILENKSKIWGSSAGHNGIKSIDKFIGKDYSRVRWYRSPKTKEESK